MQNASIKTKVFIFVMLSAIFSGIMAPPPAAAQTDNCTLSYSECEALRKELSDVTAEIERLQKIYDSQKQKSNTLAGEIAFLKTKIDKARASINAKNLSIRLYSNDISKKQSVINSLTAKIDRQKQGVAELMRKANEIDSYSLVEVILTGDDLSKFFEDADAFVAVRENLRESVRDLSGTKKETAAEKEALERKRNQEADAKAAIEAEKREIERNQTEQKKLLALSQDQEKAYSQVIAERAKRAAEIRAALFTLRDSAPIPFGQALEYANAASQKTGVRPAFLLAIITQESSLGKNVGSCYVRNFDTGDGVSVSSGLPKQRTMHPTRDIPTFLDILKELGINDPENTRVSCWIPAYYRGEPSGWGGAMGPAQFIPSTWKLFKNRVADLLGKRVANPWMPQDAFMASALYLSDLGADKQTFSAERNAACRYYSGSSCTAKASAASYGNSVMRIASNIQENMIDLLKE